MVAPLAGGVALAAVLNAGQLGIWAAPAVSLAVAIAGPMCLRARHWTQAIIRHLQNPPPREICLGQVCARPYPWTPHAPALPRPAALTPGPGPA